MQVLCTEELLSELAERVIVSEAGACMLIVEKLAGQKPCSERPVQPMSALKPFLTMTLKRMAGQLDVEVSHT